MCECRRSQVARPIQAPGYSRRLDWIVGLGRSMVCRRGGQKADTRGMLARLRWRMSSEKMGLMLEVLAAERAEAAYRLRQRHLASRITPARSSAYAVDRHRRTTARRSDETPSAGRAGEFVLSLERCEPRLA